MKNAGKQFEADFANSVPSFCLLHRLKDSAQSYNNSKNTLFAWDNPCDFFLFDCKHRLFYTIECKSTKYKSISFQTDKNDKSSKMIKYHQIESLRDFSKHNYVVSGFLFNFRDEENDMERTYFQSISDFDRMIKNINKVSLNEMDLLLHNAVKISGERKRVHYKWSVEELLENMNKKYMNE